MTALEVTHLLAEIMGLLGGIFSVAIFINFIIRKISSKTSLKQKYISSLLSTILYMTLPCWVQKLTDPYDIMGNIILSFLCGMLVCYFIYKEVGLRKFLLFELFGFLGFGILVFIMILILRSNYRSIFGTLNFIASFIIFWFLFFKRNILGSDYKK